MAQPPNHKATVEQVRRLYGPTLTRDQCVAVCNAVAWQHRSEGFGIAEKTSGTRGKRRDGQEASIDGLVYKWPDGSHVDQFIDILVNADGTTPPAAQPSWQVSETSNRKWIAPISPDPTPTPEPPDPPPSGDYVTKAEFDIYKQQMSAALKDITDDVSALTIKVGDLQGQIDALDARVDALEAAPPGAPREYVLVPDDTAPPVNTSASAWHSHAVRARVVPKPPV